MSLGFTVQNVAVGNTTPVAVSADQAVKYGCRLKALAANGANYIYFGFFLTDAEALAGLTTSTGYQLAAGIDTAIDVGMLQGDGADIPTGNLKYLYVLASGGTLGVCCYGK